MSKYFTYFPKVEYDLMRTGDSVQLTNLLKRFRFDIDSRNQLNVFYTYTIQHGDRPDTIAEKFYGDSKLDWVVLHYNYIINPLFQWPLFGEDFNNYVAKKYGSVRSANETVEKYYKIVRPRVKDATKDIPEWAVEVDQTTYNTLGESSRRFYTAYEWEVIQNDNNAEIKLLDELYLDQLLREVKVILRDN
jgi:hypothetical protein